MAIDGVGGLLTEVAKFTSHDCSKARICELPDSFAIAIEEFTLQKGASLSSTYFSLLERESPLSHLSLSSLGELWRLSLRQLSPLSQPSLSS
jgi:hypothetical protein